MGGNKLRKLEYIVPDAIASNADTLVSIGGVQSNHTRMVAATAAKIGMKCVVIQEAWVPHEDAVYDRVGNILMTRLMGADSRIVDDGFDIGIRKSWEDAIQSVKDSGGKPYGIPAGASVHKYGGLGYVGFAEEVRAQEAQMGIKFDYIIVCVVTGSTQAGMIVGFAADDRAHRVIGIDGSGTPAPLRKQVREIVDNTANLVELGRKVRDDEIVILEDYAYPAYGVPSHETSDAIRFAARTEAMITDPVYEGKSKVDDGLGRVRNREGAGDLGKKGYFPGGRKGRGLGRTERGATGRTGERAGRGRGRRLLRNRDQVDDQNALAEAAFDDMYRRPRVLETCGRFHCIDACLLAVDRDCETWQDAGAVDRFTARDAWQIELRGDGAKALRGSCSIAGAVLCHEHLQRDQQADDRLFGCLEAAADAVARQCRDGQLLE